MIRIVLVDDQTLVRNGISGLLSLTDDIVVVGEAADGEHALAVINKEKPDVVLLDIRMPVISGIEVLKILKRTGTLPPTILLTTFDDDLALLEGMCAGAKGYLLKDITLAQLTEAVRNVAAGNTLFRPVIVERLLRGLQEGTDPQSEYGIAETLTAREKETLRLIADGLNNKEIATLIGPSEGTIKNHVSSIMAKLGVRDRVRAVLKGIELGYI
jgi:DNA-binding NarL/FixJ family response regulator